MKKNFLNLTAAIVFGLGLAACTGFKQDPFSDKEDAIKNATPPSTKPVQQTGPDRILFDVPLVNTFKEGVEGKLQIDYRSLLSGPYKYWVEISNLDSFPGATFDNQKNIFTWKPAPGTVDSGMAVKTFELQVTVFAEPTDGSSKTTRKETLTAVVAVENDMEKPTITGVKYNGNLVTNLQTEEGKVVTLEVQVRDNTDGKNTSLMFSALSNYRTVSPYAKFLGKTLNDPIGKIWSYTVQVDLTNAEITTGMDTASFLVSAVNEWGQVSVPYSVNMTVLTRMGATASTLPTAIQAKAGQLTTIPFVISDSLNESYPEFAMLSGADINTVRVDCERNPDRVFIMCSVLLNPTATQVGQSFTFQIVTETRGSAVQDSRRVRNNINVNYTVVAP